jgi:general L-amino acid transport system substrate-binding protein
MLDAEELGVTQKNVDQMLDDRPDLKRAFGADSNPGRNLGTSDWVVRIVKAVGNYVKSFDRNLGGYSESGIARGLNRLWIHGGLQYAPPIR